ncbi:MAG: methionine biosynthesis protein MetW [Deltaproteobacteria bacterium RIFOXYD12_FULL_57_12]|nr:MAG: methionine biosynthesis protein MetW [Deltaproteobacteria bacterium RIFOXYD12_FULL_57_12]
MRFDLQIIASWITAGARVLDLGCGNGDLLDYLRQHKKVSGTGIERQEARVAEAIARGLSVLQGDISVEVLDYQDNSFDYVILSQTLQQVYAPAELIRAMLRIGRKVIVSFPNFGHWLIRMQILTTGHTPITRELPYQWHDTPNIRILSIKDFERFADEIGFAIIKQVAINTHHHEERGNIIRFLPNLRATYGIILIGKGDKA